MKSRVYLMFLATLIGMSGTLFSGTYGDEFTARRPWMKESEKSKILGLDYVPVGTYVRYLDSLTSDNLVKELELVKTEVSIAAESKNGEDKLQRAEWRKIRADLKMQEQKGKN